MSKIHSYSKCNFVSGSYTSRDDIEHFKFRIKLKEINETIPILKIDFPSETGEDPVETENVGYYEERTFSWQEKVRRNSSESTDEDHNETKEKNEETEHKQSRQRILSYIDKDNYVEQKSITTDTKVSTPAESTEEEHCQKMYIIVDMNDYKRESSPAQEHILFSVIWYPIQKHLRVTPDFNNLQTDPYALEVSYNSKQLFHYSIEHLSDGIDEYKATESETVKRIARYENDVRLRKAFTEFIPPSDNRLRSVVLFEILSAHGFEYDNLYVEYTVEIPCGFVCDDDLKGVTHISSTGPEKNAHFSHLVELHIDFDLDSDQDVTYEAPQVLMEVISCDFWGRRRTEGYCRARLQIATPGRVESTLIAINPRYKNERLWEMDRYFIGGHRAFEEISAAGVPLDAQGDCVWKGGLTCAAFDRSRLRIAIAAILQSRAFEEDPKSESKKSLNSRSLFESAGCALSAYEKAKRNFEECSRSDGARDRTGDDAHPRVLPQSDR